MVNGATQRRPSLGDELQEFGKATGKKIIGQTIKDAIASQIASTAGSATGATSALAAPQIISATAVPSAGAAGAGLGAATTAGSLLAAAAPAAAAVAAPLVAQGTVTGIKGAIEGDRLSAQEQIALALPTFGASFLFNPIKKALGGTRTNIEEGRWKRLIDAGLPPELVSPDALKDVKEAEGRKDLPGDFVGFDDQGVWVNNRFATTRDEKDLTGNDITGFAAWTERLGENWHKNISGDQRLAIANKALELGLINEDKGSLDVNFENPDFKNFINGVFSGQVPVQRQSPLPPKPVSVAEEITQTTQGAIPGSQGLANRPAVLPNRTNPTTQTGIEELRQIFGG